MAVAAAAAWLASFSGPSDAEVAWAAELKDTSNALHDLARDLADTDARLLRGDNAARFADSLRRCAAATEVQRPRIHVETGSCRRRLRSWTRFTSCCSSYRCA